MKYILVGIIFLTVSLIFVIPMKNKSSFVNYVAHYAPDSQKDWFQRSNWKRFGFPYYSFWEKFTNMNSISADISSKISTNTMDYPPNSPDSVNLHNNIPYHLLGDEMQPPRMNETLSCVNSRSCYATDFQKMIDKTGNYRQFTNNYKRNYPDSCYAPHQELVLNFYKAKPL